MNLYTLTETEFLGIPMVEVRYLQDISQLELHREPYHRMVVHHPGSRDYSIEGLIDLHVNKNGWGAIGYHFCIDETGNLLSTRSLALKGAHAFPNTGKIGVAFLRSFRHQDPNEKELHALARLARALGGESSLPILGHNQDQLYELAVSQNLDGHYPELLQRLSVPSSEDDFQQARRELYDARSGIEFQKQVAKLKTCPGARFYQAVMSP